MRRIILALIGLMSALLFSGNQAAQPTDQPPDWADCLACHDNPGADLPQLSVLRPVSGRIMETNCRDCHTLTELMQVRFDWRHATRPVAVHLSCTDCHPASAHGPDQSPPLPYGDYDAEGCYACHRTVEMSRLRAHAHGNRGGIRCIDCHPPHDPLSAALPSTVLPVGVERVWVANYEWLLSNKNCLSCHGPLDITARLDQGFVTLNTENYHDLHVIGARILCIECHDPHGSMRNGMLRQLLLTGEVFSYYERIDGGSCNIRCHGIEHDSFSYVNEVF